MSQKKQCVRCNRTIDAAAKSCLYCNWWQADPPPPRVETAVADDAAATPAPRWSRKLLGGIAFAALLIIAFVIGSFIHGFEPREVKAAQESKTASAAPAAPATVEPQANVQLVPDNTASTTTPSQPATAVQPATPLNGAMNTDATAMTSQQYGAVPQQPRTQTQTPQTVDPRSLTGTAYQQGDQTTPRPKRRSPAATAPHIVQTQPVPVYQPVPSLGGHGHARLTLTVGADGHVKEIDVIAPFQGEMGRLVAAVQSWRFRPATQNGAPVASRFTVDINVE